jgi:small-conductance mechanosensitive channel
MELSGESFRTISLDTGYSESALKRHKSNHLGQDVQDIRAVMQQARIEALEEAKAREKEEIKEDIVAEARETTAARLENAASFIDQLREVRDKAANLLDQAEASDDLRAAGTFLKELREQIRLMAELEGRLAAQPQITIINNPEWVEVRSLIITALDPFPQAKEAVVHAIRGR